MIRPDKQRALFIARKLFSEIVYDTAALEGSPYTFPEVQTLLENVTVGGHSLSDQQLVLQQAKSWKRLIEVVRRDEFQVSKEMACELNGIVAFEEALEWGVFRDGPVRIAGTEWVPPGHERLDELFDEVVDRFHKQGDLFARAVVLFLDMARYQFFYDGNKRTGRLMMNGVLMSHGYPPISIPARRRLEFNTKMIRFYDTGETIEMIDFVLDCGGLA